MPSVGDFLIERLSQAGVKHAFGVPGDYVLNFYDQVSRSKLIEMVNTTNEANAGFAADGYARANGVGCAVITYCVGGFSILNSIGGAYAEKSPVVVISGSPGLKERQERMLLHHMVREFECQHQVFSNVTVASTVLRNPATAAYEIDRVLEACLSLKGPVYIEIPRDVVGKPVAYDLEVGTPGRATSDPEAMEESLAEVIRYINGSSNPVIVAGVEMARYGMAEQLRRFAEQTGIPVATTLLGKSVFDERHPLALGVYGGRMSREAVASRVDNSDCLIMLGVMQTDVNLGFLPLKIGQRKVVLATSEGVQVRNAQFPNVLFRDFVDALFASQVSARPGGAAVKTQPPRFVPKPDARLTVPRFFAKMESVLDTGMAIIADTGDSMFGAADLTVPDNNSFFAPAFYTSMGFAVPACLGVMAAKPGVRPLVFVGDGAFQMTGMEISTLVRRGLNPIIFVLNNQGYLTERMLLDGPYNDLQEWAYDRLPEVIGGGVGYLVKTEGELEKAVAESLADHRLSIIHMRFDKTDHSDALSRFASKLKKRL
jgi:indolepyruvate decarboxylase